jgi:3'(2'), 5'-bisphosphate nucleotidase
VTHEAKITTDTNLAAYLATKAGRILLDLQRSGTVSGKALGDAGDRAANRFLMDALRAERPDDAILSEEEVNDTARCAQSRVWIIDPLDGTREYADGRGDWAVHVALAIDGLARVGAVALPVVGVTLDSGTIDPVTTAVGNPPRMVISRTRPPEVAHRLAETLGAELIPMGSAGAKAMAVVRGLADIYVHAGGQSEWDNAAPVAVAMAAGLHCTRLDGSPLTYNAPDPLVPDLVICRQELASEVAALLASYTA